MPITQPSPTPTFIPSLSLSYLPTPFASISSSLSALSVPSSQHSAPFWDSNGSFTSRRPQTGAGANVEKGSLRSLEPGDGVFSLSSSSCFLVSFKRPSSSSDSASSTTLVATTARSPSPSSSSPPSPSSSSFPAASWRFGIRIHPSKPVYRGSSQRYGVGEIQRGDRVSDGWAGSSTPLRMKKNRLWMAPISTKKSTFWIDGLSSDAERLMKNCNLESRLDFSRAQRTSNRFKSQLPMSSSSILWLSLSSLRI